MMRQGIANREEDKTALESPYQKIQSILQNIHKERKDALCGLWEEDVGMMRMINWTKFSLGQSIWTRSLHDLSQPFTEGSELV